MTALSPKILVIDDEQHQLDSICRGLLLYGYRYRSVPSAEAAEGEDFCLVLVGSSTLGRSGLELIERIRKKWSDLPIVVIKGLSASAEVEIARNRNILFLEKPFDPDKLDTTIRRALNRNASNA